MSGEEKKTFSLSEIVEITGVDASTVRIYVEREWIFPVAEQRFDDEDAARVRLIRELQTDFGINEAAVPVVLHLLDQLYYLRERMRRLGSS